MTHGKPSLLRRMFDVPAEIVVGLYVIVDAIVAPLFRPIMRFLSSLQVIRRVERFIASLPPYVILVVMVVPFAIAELAKVFAVFLMSEGHFRTGLTIFIGAYIVSILVCERIFHAGKGQLMTIGWFATCFNWLMGIKAAILGWFRTTQVWQMAVALKEKARLSLQRLRTRMGIAAEPKPKDAFERH